MKLNPQNALWYKQLCEKFPLLASIKEELKNDSFIPKLIEIYQKFFFESISTSGRAALNASLKTKLAHAPAELAKQIQEFAGKFFTTKPDTQSSETIIPDILLILLAKYPLPDLSKNYDILELMYGACEAQSFKGITDNAEHKKLLYLIEWQAPGLLSRALDLSTKALMTIDAEIKTIKSSNPQYKPADVEFTAGKNLGFSDGKKRIKRSPLHPASRFLTQDLPHRNFANSFPDLVARDLSVKRLAELEKSYAQFFKLNPQIPTNIDAEKILLIVDKYKLTPKMGGLKDPNDLKQQCDRIIAIDNMIQKGPKIKRPKTMTDDNIWEQEEAKCYQHYFLFLYENPNEKPAPEKIIEDFNQFKQYLYDKAFNGISSIKLMHGEIFPETMKILTEENAPEFNKIRERLFKTIENKAALIALAKTNGINLDEVMSIALRNQLSDGVRESTSNSDIIRQSRNILHIAAQVNTDAKDEKYKPAMMQLALQLPDAYKYFKVNTENLKNALDIVKNRGGKSNDVVINELRCIGDKNEQKRALLALGITQIESKQVQAVYTIYHARKECFKTNQKYTAREVLQANQASGGNKNLFEFFLNSTVNKNDPELVRCMAQLAFAKNGEAVLAYYKAQGNTPSFQYLSLATAAIAREGNLLDEDELTLLSNFLITQMGKNALTLTTDEPNITDLCDYYNNSNKNTRPIGTILIAQRDTAKLQTYAHIEELFKEINLQGYKDDIIAIYAYYLGYKKSTDFIYKTMEKEIKNTADVPVFYNQLKRAHFAVMACKNKSLLKLEFQFPGASRFAAQIKGLKKNRKTTFNYNERILYAIEIAKLGFDDPKDVFLFAFNYPDIAKQCIDQETYIDIISLGEQSHDVLQLRLFLRQLETQEPDLDFSDVFDNLTGQTSSTHAPMLGSSSRSNNTQNSRLSDADLKKYVTAFYLIENSQYTNVDKFALQKKLGKYLQDNNKLGNNLSSIKELEAQLGINNTQIINLNDNWNLISDDEAKVYSGIFNQTILNRADLIYAFYCFRNYPIKTQRQEILFTALQDYISGTSTKEVYLQNFIENSAFDEKKYKSKLVDLRAMSILRRDFSFVTDATVKSKLMDHLRADPHYKQTLLKELTLDRKFTAKPHYKDENKMRDELLAIHLQYGEGLSAYFRRFNDDKLNYVSAYMSVCEVAAQTQKYCESNSSANKNEAFLIHLHWLAFKYLRADEPSAEFIKKHQAFTAAAQGNDFVKTMSLDMQIPLRNKLVELDRVEQFFEDAQKNPIAAYRNYTFLYELIYKRNRTDLKNEKNFTQHPVFIVFSLIRDNGFLSLREKENLYNIAFIDPEKFTPDFLKLTGLLGIYPLLLMVGKDRLIKKYAKELNRKIQLNNPEKLAGLPIKLDELLEVVNDETTLATLQKIIKSKGFATASPLSVIDDAHKEYEKFIMRTFPGELQNETLAKRLQRLELASSGILDDICETNAKDIDDVLSMHNDHSQKIAWLTQLVDSIEEIINLDDPQTLATANDYYGDEIKAIVAAISADSEFLNDARTALGLNVLSKDKLKDIKALLPNILACYAQYKDVICFYILTHTTELLENPSGPYSHILSVAKLLEQYNINPKDYNNALMEIVFAYPLLVRTMNNPACVKNMNYAMLERYETRPEVLLCIQYLNSQQDIVSFIDYINKADAANKIDIKLKNLANYLGTLAQSTLSVDEKNILALKLIESFKEKHAPFAKFDNSMPHIGELAGYSYQVSVDLPTNDLYIDSLSQRLESLTSNSTHRGLSFDAVLSCHSAAKTSDQLTISAQKLDAKNTYEANVSLDVKVISNMVNINASTLYAHADVIGNENYSLTNEKNLTVKVTKNEIFNMHNAQISGPADTPVQILALLTVYNEFIEDEIKAKAGVNFLHLGIIAADYQRNGLNRKIDKYYHLTNWQQQNMAAATYALLANDSSSFDDIYKGRNKDRNLKFNAACQLYETGLALYLLETPISTYNLSNNQLVQQINFTNNMHNPQQLQSILKQLSKFNDLKQFNHGICSQKNLGLIAEVFDCHYEVGKDNIATLLYKYRKGEIKTPFADQLYAQFDFLLRGIIQEEQFFEALSKCADLPANDPSVQSKLLKHYAVFSPKPSNTAQPAVTTNSAVSVPKTKTTTFTSIVSSPSNKK
ncbi:MAG: hypothetical protein WC748_04435 [Legionellales bacterium]|jgi:hypothetical protein